MPILPQPGGAVFGAQFIDPASASIWGYEVGINNFRGWRNNPIGSGSAAPDGVFGSNGTTITETDPCLLYCFGSPQSTGNTDGTLSIEFPGTGITRVFDVQNLSSGFRAVFSSMPPQTKMQGGANETLASQKIFNANNSTVDLPRINQNPVNMQFQILDTIEHNCLPILCPQGFILTRAGGSYAGAAGARQIFASYTPFTTLARAEGKGWN
jgi:hypothetical protein